MKNTANVDSLLQLIHKDFFKNLVEAWEVDKNTTKFKTALLLRVMLGAFTLRLPNYREINLVFGVPKSTLSDALRSRSYGFFEELCAHVLEQLRHKNKNRKLKRTLRELFAIDSSEIKVHGSLIRFPGFEQSRSKNAGAKIHVLWNVHEHWIEGFHTTHFNASDLTTAKKSLGSVVPGAMYVFDRAYIDLSYWMKITTGGAHFTTRLKEHTRYDDLKQKVLIESDKSGVLYDGEWVPSKRAVNRAKLPNKNNEVFRQVIYRDPASKKVFHFLTSDFEIAAQEVANIYKKRWGVELLFRWMKGQMNIRRLHVKSRNGVKSILAIAFLMHLLLLLKKTVEGFEGTLSEFLKQLRSNQLRKMPTTKAYPEHRSTTSSSKATLRRSTA